VALTQTGKLDATTDFSIVQELDTINICVPTPLRKTKDPDMSYIVSAVEAIAKHLHKGMLIVLESTTYPGTTDEVVQPLLEATGLKAGVDFFIAFSPERVDPGNPTVQTHNVPKVVGGLTPDCLKLAAALYGTAIQTIVPVSSTRVAEMVKLLENTFRAVNIGLVNELALMCDKMNIDVWEVVDAAKTKPFGFMAFYPGPGLGGHCIPIDPFYLSWKAKQTGFDPRFIELAGHINAGMPHYVAEKVAEALNTKRKAVNGSNILIAGVAYKRDCDDVRESPALDVMGLLHGKGATVAYADPHVPEVYGREWSGRLDIKAVELSRGSIGRYDCVVIITDHKAFDYDAIVAEADIVVDTRNAIKKRYPHVFRLGAPGPEHEDKNVAVR
jgi:UDP-N-acetyl-D-glucosamine dehydrogenase